MTKEFAALLNKDMNKTYTENGAVANATTNSFVLDLFSQIGALRNGRGAANALSMLRKAYAENKELTMKCLFWARDIRGGAGERDTFKIFMKDLMRSDTIDSVIKNLHLIPEYGRWDDLWMFLEDKRTKPIVIKLIKDQLKVDAKVDRPSLLAKWLPSENTSSRETVALATFLRKELGLSSKEYRKVLSTLREKISIVEKKMSSNQWDKVVYEHVPSRASMLYRKAFGRHDTERYGEYLKKVLSGEKKINSAALFPYEILQKYSYSYYSQTNETLEALWKNLPNYIETSDDAIVVADTSGSMNGIPLDVAISLAIYIAERNHGCWKDKFITFSETPQLQTIIGTSLLDKIRNVSSSVWGMNTNVEAVFDLILNTAVKNHLPADKMLKKVIIISDMEFDQAAGRKTGDTLFRTISSKFVQKGYKMPQLVFWNVRSAKEQFPMSTDDKGFINVSGSSPAICKQMFGSKLEDPIEFMLKVLGSERYSKVSG